MNHESNHGGRGPRSLWRLLPLVAILALGLVATGANAASAAEPAVPFKASVSGTVSLGDLGTFELAGAGKAVASHLGVVSYAANGQFTGPDTDTLTETFTAANGDTLTILCQQVLEVIGPGLFHGTDTWIVTGGTGRFSGATGSGTGDTYVDLNTFTFTKELTGSISY